MSSKTGRLVWAWCMAGCLIAGAAAAQERYPNRPVRMVVPFSAGTLVDIIGRWYAQDLTRRMGQNVIVDNRAGAGGTVGSAMVASANPDGHTLLMISSGHAVNPSLYAKLPYDTLRDFASVAVVATSPTVLVINPELGPKTVKDFIAYAKQQTGKLNYGSAGVGSATHLAPEYFRQVAGFTITHVPFKGVQEAVTEVIAGRVHVAFPPVALALSQVRSGRLLALAVTGAERSALLPNVPTVQESGYPGFDLGIWYGLFAPVRTPQAVLGRLAQEIRAITDQPDIRERMSSQAIVPLHLTLKDADAFVAAEVDKLGKLIKASGAKAN